jgi:hypothetical protein
MKPGNGQKVLVYFLSASFLLMMNGLPRMAAGATERGIAIGEMISKGEVKFEARENVWRSVEPSHFPVIQLPTGSPMSIGLISDPSAPERLSLL